MTSSAVGGSLIVYILLAFVLPSPSVSAYNILVLPVIGKSHVFSMVAMADGLAARNHSVTVVVGKRFPLDEPEIEVARLRGIRYERYEHGDEDYEAMVENVSRSVLDNQLRMDDMLPMIKARMQSLCRTLIVDNEPLFDRLAAAKFDLVVVDGTFYFKCNYLIPHRLGLPFVSYSNVIDPLLARVPWLPSFVPNGFTTYSDRMSFIERLKNTAMTVAFSFMNPIPDSPIEVFADYQRYGSFKTLDDLMAKTLLWLIPKDHVLDYAKPTMPNIVFIGGLTVKRTTGELSADLKAFVEGARSSTILVSFGSMMPSFPRPIVDKFFDAFRRLNADGYRVVWRLKNRDNVPTPSNVMTMNWIPQNDLLAHSAVKLFVTHCGNNGQYEALYHGVPMIGFPVMGDQEHNGRRLQYKGFGIWMNIYNFTSDELLQNIRLILGEKTYTDRVRKASAIFRSAPQTPVERSAYWIEHVTQFGGDHLRSGGQDLPLHAWLMLDLAAAVLISVGIALCCVWKLVGFVCRRACGRRDKKIPSSTDKLKTN